MTTTYEATGKTCINCGDEVEDYTGHWEASEVTACNDCYPTVAEKYDRPGRVVHNVPKKEDN